VQKWTIEKVLKFALKKEMGSIRLYSDAQNKVSESSSKEFLKTLVREENEHKNKIMEIMENPEKISKIGKSETIIQNLKIVDYLVDVDLSLDADYQQILIYAGKREKEAHDLYMKLASYEKGSKISRFFSQLAREELKHKYNIEQEYDDIILKYM
jgi:rubrerythrin